MLRGRWADAFALEHGADPERETWFESPGARHQVSANASDTEPARLLAVLVVDVADEQLVIPDPQ